MKKVMISLLLCASSIIAKADAQGIEVIESIENVDTEGLINALSRENPTQKELNLYISIAEKKYDSFQARLRLWRDVKILAAIGVPLGTIAGLVVGGIRGARGAGLEGAVTIPVGAAVGSGAGAVASITALSVVSRQVTNYEKKAEKARTIVLILRNALQKREK